MNKSKLAGHRCCAEHVSQFIHHGDNVFCLILRLDALVLVQSRSLEKI